MLGKKQWPEVKLTLDLQRGRGNGILNQILRLQKATSLRTNTILRKLLLIWKTFKRVEKNKIAQSKGSSMGEHVERDSLIVLDDVSGLADKPPSSIAFMTDCWKFGCSLLLYVFHETVQSSPR